MKATLKQANANWLKSERADWLMWQERNKELVEVENS